MNPYYLLSLRRTLNSLIERAWIIRRLADDIDPLIMGGTIPLDPVYDPRYEDGVEWDDPEPSDGPDGPIPLFSETVLRSVMNRTYASNTLSAIRSLREMTGVPFDQHTDYNALPNIDGWAIPELEAFVKTRETLIVSANKSLRDAHTRLAHYLPKVRAILPSVSRERALAGGDLFQRVDVTFDPNRETTFFERGFLTAWLNAETANHILDRLERMTQAAAPLPGEPPTLSSFSNRTNNQLPFHQIKIHGE